MFNIEDDGIKVTKERVEKWSYIKYPPHSKYLLRKNITLLLTLTFLLTIGVVPMFMFDKNINWSYYLLLIILITIPISIMYGTYIEWKKGKYWK